ncbi:Folylpolyglutamate synthetase [Onygenales sp. PD_40]|nr:Folylpolyglutamate synthetase [Onygenales sp. PD_40]
MELEEFTYHNAVRLLNSTQTRFDILNRRRLLSQKLDEFVLDQMRQWIRDLGYTVDDLNRLNIIHVAGTKGKGTTCAYVNSILGKYHESNGIPRKIGLYTSPHLMSVRERIQINGEPISEELFAKYFLEVWNCIKSSATKEGRHPTLMPPYFRFLTLMPFHVFMSEGVDTAVYEVGVGGELDSTNIFTQPAATAITTLGIDHVHTLGNTIEKIAWHKAGIFKSWCPAFTTQQPRAAMEVLKKRASERNAGLTVVGICPALEHVDIKPTEDFQMKNASLAISLAHTALEKLGVAVNREREKLPDNFVRGLEEVQWRGRCERLTINGQHWHLDGAHTEDSLRLACSWFVRVSRIKICPRILIFNQQGTRDAVSLVKSMHHTLYSNFGVLFQHALFCTNTTYRGNKDKAGINTNCSLHDPTYFDAALTNLPPPLKDHVDINADPKALQNLSLQRQLANTWQGLDNNTQTRALASVEEAVDYVRDISNEVGETQILVTGSLRLIGGVLSVLGE